MAIQIEQQLEDLRYGDHLCLIYESESERMAAVLPFLMAGLTRGECCVCIAAEHPTGQDIAALAQAGVDCAREQERGALRLLTVTALSPGDGELAPEGVIAFLDETVQAALSSGFSGVRITGPLMGAMGSAAGCKQLAEFEMLLEGFLSSNPVIALCQYPRGHLPPEDLYEGLRTHPIALVGSQVCPNLYYEPPAMVAGEGSCARRVEWMIDRLQRARAAEQTLMRQNQCLKLLSEAAGHLLSTTDPDSMVRGLFDKLSAQLGLAGYFNFMVNGKGDALRLDSCAGIPEETARELEHLEFGQAVCGAVALERRPIVASRIQTSEDPRVQLVKGLGMRAYACNPLLVEDRLLGTLSFATRNRDQFEADELEVIRTICHYVAMAKERQRLTTELTDRAARLAEADRRKDEFLAMLAHELRNPLGASSNALHLIRRLERNDPALHRAVSVLERQVQHQVRIVDDLLDVSRITRGRIQLHRTRLELVSLLHLIVEDHRHALEQAGLRLMLELPTEPVWVFGDATRLEQVVGNLLTNAAKFTDPGGQVHVDLRIADCGLRNEVSDPLPRHYSATRNPQSAFVTIRDTGIGIESRNLPHVFEAFAQADRSLDRSRGGLGLGLALVKGLIEMHGGTVRAESAGLGQGATFTFTLPLEYQRPAAHPESVSRPRISVTQRILVVEDNADAADSLKELLELSGHQVATAMTGPAGLEAARQFQPEVVLCDIGLPGFDGYELARLLRRDPSTASAPMVALSGYGREEDRHRSRQAGFRSHLTMPVNLQELELLLTSLPGL
jgi:signal transduction histidine kinase